MFKQKEKMWAHGVSVLLDVVLFIPIQTMSEVSGRAGAGQVAG